MITFLCSCYCDNLIIPEFSRQTGYSFHEAVGRNCRFLQVNNAELLSANTFKLENTHLSTVLSQAQAHTRVCGCFTRSIHNFKQLKLTLSTEDVLNASQLHSCFFLCFDFVFHINMLISVFFILIFIMIAISVFDNYHFFRDQSQN